MTHEVRRGNKPWLMRQQWLSLIVVAILLVVAGMLFVRYTSTSVKTSGTIYSSIKHTAAAFTVGRTYTSRSTIVVNNLWRPTVQLSGGGYSNCALSNGNVYCWGRGLEGQLGNSASSNTIAPVPVTTSILNGQRMTNIAAGKYHMCAVNSGLAACWGQNTYGQLGRASGNTTSSNQPVQVATFSATLTPTQIAGGAQSTCAIADNIPLCWGDNSKGQLGDNTTTSRTIPGAPTGSPQRSVAPRATVATDGFYNKSVTQIQVGGLFACGIANGAVYCWGDNTYGQVGDNTTTQRNLPTAVKATVSTDALYGKTINQIALGYDYACALSDGAAYCWGRNDAGQLGNGNTGTNSSVPVQVNGLLSGKTVTGLLNGGYKHMCAIADGQAYCWGLNTSGQLGNGNTTSSNTPVLVNLAGVLSGKTVTQLVGGDLYTCAIANGRAYCWGDNTYGQLGTNDSSQASSNIPYRVNDSYY